MPAFVATYGAEELQELEGAAVFPEAIEEQDDVSLTEADRPTSRRWRRGSICTPRCGPPNSQARLAEKPARRPPGEPAVPEPLFRRVDRSMPRVTAPDGTLGVAAISLGSYTKSFASE